jgi:hypothetical protein
MMWKDEIVEEVRAARDAYAAQFDYDLVRIFEDIKKGEREHPERLADLRPLKPRKANAIPPTDGPVG